MKNIEDLKKYPHLYGAVWRFVVSGGKSEEVGHIPDFVYFFKKLYTDYGIEPDEMFDWDTDTSEDFGSWGSNSRWSNTAWCWIQEHLDECIQTAIDYAEMYGDILDETNIVNSNATSPDGSVGK